MSWTEYYDILKKHGSFRQAPKKEMNIAKRGNPNDPFNAMKLALQKYNKEKYGCAVLSHVHDGDCPQCGFPETIIIRDVKDDKILAEECSKSCGWYKKIKP
jgi:hypothetical protein